jgi:hypothetical protein
MSKIALAGCVLAGCGTQALAAQEVPVGRLDVRLPGDGWEVHSIADEKNTISGDGHTHQQTTDYKALVHRGPDQVVDAVLLVRANVSGIGRFSGLIFTDTRCEGPKGVYAVGGPDSRSYRCLQVTPQASISPTDVPEDVSSMLTKLGWRLPPSMFVVSATQYATTGSFAVVVAYLRPLAGTPATDGAQGIPDTLPPGVAVTSVQWGRQLQEAVRDSVYSIRGKLTIPEWTLADEARAPTPLPAEPSPPAKPARAPAPPLSNQG